MPWHDNASFPEGLYVSSVHGVLKTGSVFLDDGTTPAEFARNMQEEHTMVHLRPHYTPPVELPRPPR
jgi:hypothetical protein